MLNSVIFVGACVLTVHREPEIMAETPSNGDSIRLVEIDRRRSKRRYLVEHLDSGEKEWIFYDRLNHDNRAMSLILQHNQANAKANQVSRTMRIIKKTPKGDSHQKTASASKVIGKKKHILKQRRAKSLGGDSVSTLDLDVSLTDSPKPNKQSTPSIKPSRKSSLIPGKNNWSSRKQAAKRVLNATKKGRSNQQAMKNSSMKKSLLTSDDNHSGVATVEASVQVRKVLGKPRKFQIGDKTSKRTQSPASKLPDKKSGAKKRRYSNKASNGKPVNSSFHDPDSSPAPKRKRKMSASSNSSTSSGETLYSLSTSLLDAYVPVGKPKLSPASTERFYKAIALHKKEREIESAASTPASSTSDDSEITFKVPTASSSPVKKEVVKCKNSLSLLSNKVGSTSSFLPTTPKSPLCNSLGASASYKLTPDTAGDSAINAPSPLRHLPTTLGARQDPVLAPASPTAPRYESLLKQLQSRQKTLSKRRDGSESDGSTSETSNLERRLSVRQSESAFKYKEIVVKKAEGYTQVTLSCQTKAKNALNPKVIQELLQLLHGATYDNSRVMLITGSGNVFCSGVDLHYLLNSPDRRAAARNMANALKELVSALLSFPKPVVAAVNGSALGLGVTLLPLCDVVYASDKATFCCPYTQLGQTPEACASYTFPQAIGMAMTNELLLTGRKMTAMEACQCGLVSQVFWPTSFMQDVIPRVALLATQSTYATEASKMLIRSHQRSRLDAVNIAESQMLCDRWASAECYRSIKTYMDTDLDL